MEQLDQGDLDVRWTRAGPGERTQDVEGSLARQRVQMQNGQHGSTWGQSGCWRLAAMVGLGFSVETEKRKWTGGPRETVQLKSQTKASFCTF